MLCFLLCNKLRGRLFPLVVRCRDCPLFPELSVVKSDRCLKDVDFLRVLPLLIFEFLRIILVEFQFLEKMLKLMLLIKMSMLL